MELEPQFQADPQVAHICPSSFPVSPFPPSTTREEKERLGERLGNAVQ